MPSKNAAVKAKGGIKSRGKAAAQLRLECSTRRYIEEYGRK
jgi:hypothetical protein